MTNTMDMDVTDEIAAHQAPVHISCGKTGNDAENRDEKLSVTTSLKNSLLEPKSELFPSSSLITDLEKPLLNSIESKSELTTELKFEPSPISSDERDSVSTKSYDNLTAIPRNTKRQITVILVVVFLLTGFLLFTWFGFLDMYLLQLESNITVDGRETVFTTTVMKFNLSCFTMAVYLTMSSITGDLIWFILLFGYLLKKVTLHPDTEKWDFITDIGTKILFWLTQTGMILLLVGLVGINLITPNSYNIKIALPGSYDFNIHNDLGKNVLTVAGCVAFKALFFTCAEFSRIIYSYILPKQ